MERNNLIAMLVGWYSAKDHSITGEDLKIKIDNDLINAHFTPLGTEENDLQLIEELLSETMMYVMSQGYNRKQRRAGGITRG